MATRSRVISLALRRSYSQHVHKEAVRPISEVPGPKAYPLIGTLPSFARGKAFKGELHEYFRSMHQKYGSIFKTELGGFTLVSLHDPDDIQAVLRHEGKLPERNDIVPWVMALEDIGETRGVFLSNGETWQRLRSSVNKHMMRPRSVASHTDDFRQVADDMVARLAKSRDSGHVIPNIQDELFKWSFESACSMLLERRLGVLTDDVPPDSLTFINTLFEILTQTEKLLFVQPQVAKALRLPIWSSFTENWKTLFRLGKMYIDEVLEDIAAKQERGEEVEGLIASMVASENLTEKELYASMLDLMGAAVDTTSNTTCMALDLLSRHSDIQEKLYDEISSVSGDDQLTYDHIQRMPYLKAVVKETLRMYPVATLIGRVLQNDVVLKGYKIPSGAVMTIMTYSMGHDPTLFPDPESFRPERWLRGQKEREDMHPYSILPFGFGPRACVGRRVAELEIYLLLTTVLRKFQLKATTNEPIQTEVRMLLRSKDPRIQFLDRE